MWAIAAILLAAALAGLVIFQASRDAARIQRIADLLRAHGDDRLPPTTIDRGLDRVETALQSVPSSDLSIEQLLLCLDEVPVGTVVADADGTIVARNHAALPYAEGRHGDALAEAAIRARLKDALLGHNTDQDLKLHGPPERILHVVGSPLIHEGELIGALVLVDDVSDQHRIDAVRRDFVANVSHELRTPVGALSLLAETIVDEPDPEIVNRFIGRIHIETTRLTRLIDDLLDLSRIEGGVGDRADTVDLGAVLREAAASVREAAEHKNVNLVLEVDSNNPKVIGDENQLVSAVTNLFENAVKYCEAGDTVEGRLASHHGEAAIAIVDSGVGIPQKDLNRVFERFYRVDRGRSSESGGTGLGLAIVRHVAFNHGGRVEVVSQEGVGSTFTIVLPQVVPSADRENV